MAEQEKRHKIGSFVVLAVIVVVVVYFSRGFYHRAETVHKLLVENKQLKQALTNLTAEEQIGYAKVLSQENKDGRVLTTIRFVETARDNMLEKILETEYSIEGDVVHFDALIVKFGDKMVTDGKEKALYLWRRVYGEKTAPQDGFAIEQSSAEPVRYAGLLKALHVKDRQLFWSSIWDLANDPEKLKDYDIKAVYGNVVYTKLRPGLIYVFKITPTGQLYPEIIPDI